MNLLKQYLTVAILLLSLPTIAQHSYPIKKISADSAWTEVEKAIKSPKGLKFRQTALLNYREEGLKFWVKYPEDSRRYKWLFAITSHSKLYFFYWKIKQGDSSYKRVLTNGVYAPIHFYSWPINKKQIDEWTKIYPKLKKEYLRNPLVDSNMKMRLVQSELEGFLSHSLNKEYLNSDKINLNKIANLISEMTTYVSVSKDIKKRIAQNVDVFSSIDALFISRYKEYGLDRGDMDSFLNKFKMDSNPFLRSWAVQRSTLIALDNEPFSLKYKSIDGDTIDLAKMKGKVVLVDFWSIWCSSCVGHMPRLKAIHNKYKKDGFEIVSVCVNDETREEDLSTVRKIENQIGANWPILMIGRSSTTNSLGQKIWQQYGFLGVPQYILLDKEGKMAMLNGKIAYGEDFEPELQKLLAEKYNSN